MYLLHELCVACESMGFAKRYFSTNSHKCKAGGCCDGIFLFLNRLECVRVLELIPVLARKAEVDRKEKLLRDLGAPFVVKFISMM